jgi:dihydroorotate dehydrogenase electron transfer subunit
MLRAVQRLAGGRGLPAFISLEQYLACGFGACLGCAVEATRGGYLKVCHDGPVLAAGDVVLRGLAGEGVGRG